MAEGCKSCSRAYANSELPADLQHRPPLAQPLQAEVEGEQSERLFASSFSLELILFLA